MPSILRVTTTIERHHPQLPRFVVVPNAAVVSWKLGGTTVIEGTLNGVVIGRRTIKKWDERNGWFIDLPEPLCRRANVETGDRVELELRIASAELPQELARLLATDASAKSVWDSMTPSQQRMVREEIRAAKHAVTRERRARRALCGSGDTT